MPEQVRLDWTSAVVSDGRLTVGFSRKPPKKWRDVFERTLALLSQERWQTNLNVRGGTVQVGPIAAGDEERVRQLLEGGVLEANTTLVSEAELFEGTGDDELAGPDADDEEEGGSPDEELTDRFRSFGRG
jgi:hypothetical protein